MQPRAAQVTTCRGIVMGRLRSPQRQLEVELMRFCFNKLGARARPRPGPACGPGAPHPGSSWATCACGE
jgi:N-dimethylarginine dimethylaminohydrolase